MREEGGEEYGRVRMRVRMEGGRGRREGKEYR